MVLDITQDALAAASGLRQADIHNYESAKVYLTRKRARQLAEGLFPKAAIGDPLGALLQVYELWLATVAAFGAPGMKARARKLRADLASVGWRLPLQVATETAGARGEGTGDREETPSACFEALAPATPKRRARA